MTELANGKRRPSAYKLLRSKTVLSVSGAGLLAGAYFSCSQEQQEPASVTAAKGLATRLKSGELIARFQVRSFEDLKINLPKDTTDRLPYASDLRLFAAHSFLVAGEVARVCSITDPSTRKHQVKALQAQVRIFHLVAYTMLPQDRNKEPYSESLPVEQQLRRQWTEVNWKLTAVSRMIDRDTPFRKRSGIVPVPRVDNAERRENYEIALQEVIDRTSNEILVLSARLVEIGAEKAATSSSAPR